MKYIALILIILMSSPSWATSVKHHTLDSLIEGSGLILEGTVFNVEYFEGNEEILPKTSYTVCDIEIIVGSHHSNCLTIDLPGATIGYKVSGYAGMPNLNLRERYILFLRKNEIYTSPFVGWWQGVYKIVEDEENHKFIQAYEGGLVYFINEKGDIIYEEISKHSVIPNYFYNDIDRDEFFISRDTFVDSIQTLATNRFFNSLEIPKGLPSSWKCRLEKRIIGENK